MVHTSVLYDFSKTKCLGKIWFFHSVHSPSCQQGEGVFELLMKFSKRVGLAGSQFS